METSPKMFAKIPNDMGNYFKEKAIKKKLGGRKISKMMGDYLTDYLDNPDKYKITIEDVLKFERLPKNGKNFTFYYKREDEARFKRLAQGSIRYPIEQATYFLYALYNYLINNE